MRLCDSRVALRTSRPLPCASFPRRLEGPQHSSTTAVCLGPGTEKEGREEEEEEKVAGALAGPPQDAVELATSALVPWPLGLSPNPSLLSLLWDSKSLLDSLMTFQTSAVC